MDPIALPNPPRRVLIIKPSAIGDVVHTLPVLNLLRRHWPNAQISWLVTPECAGVVDRHPFLHEVIHFDRKGFVGAWRNPRAILALRELAQSLRKRAFDLVIDLQGLFRSGWLSRTTHAPVRLGLSDARELAGIFYTHRVDVGPRDQHAIERYLAVTEALGAGRGPVEFPFAVDEIDRQSIAAMVPERYAVLLPGANWVTKRWPVERFAALQRPLRERFGLQTVIAGGPDDEELARQIPGVNLVGKTTLRQLVALLEGADLVIANDSGPMHIAAALGRPLVVPFGPTNAARTGPYGRPDSVIRVGIECSPCYSRRCSHISCLKWLEVDAVLDAAGKQIGHDSALSLPTL